MFYQYNGRIYKKVGVLKSGKAMLQCLIKPEIVIVVDPAKIIIIKPGYYPASGHLMYR